MKKRILAYTVVALLCVSTQSLVAQASGNEGPKILVAFFSRVGTSLPFTNVDAVVSASLPQGNTVILANMVHGRVGGDLFQIQTVDPYPAIYRELLDLARRELNTNARPRLRTRVPNMNDYDVIFLGYPNWWGTVPMAISTFLDEYDLSGKTIIPFSTHEGSGFGRSVQDIARLEPRATLREGFAVRGRSVERAQDDVNQWIAKLGY